MIEFEKSLDKAAEKAGRLLNAEIVRQAEKIVLKMPRTLDIRVKNSCFTCTFDLDISFEKFKDSGSAFNQAEIFLLPEEYMPFMDALSCYRIPIPSHFRQSMKENPNLISVTLESVEPPEFFAGRLASALQAIDQPSSAGDERRTLQ